MLRRLLQNVWGKRLLQVGGLILIAVILFFFYLPGYTRLKKLRNKNAELKARINNLKNEIAKFRTDLDRLEKDPSLWEELARKNLGVVRKDEIVVDIER